MNQRRRRTAGARIVALVVIIVAVALALTVLVLRQVMLRDLDARIDRALVQETMELNEFIDSNDPEPDESQVGFARRMLTSYLETNVTDADESLIAVQNGEAFLQSRQAHADLTSIVSRFDGLLTPTFFDETSPAGSVRILVQPLTNGDDQIGLLVVSWFVDAEYRRVDSTIWEAAGVAFAALLISSGLAWFVVRRMMRPVGLLADMAHDITEHDLSQRLPVQGTDEIASLIESFNRMLDRLEQALDSQRQFLDDAGHELRTPLTVVRGHLELADEPEKLAACRELLVGEVDRMSRLVEDLILLAKAEEFDFLRLEPVDVDDFMRELMPRLERLGKHDWHLAAAPLGIVAADQERLTQAMLNLAANAARHSPESSRIAIGAAFENSSLSLWVRDNGEGIAQDDLRWCGDRDPGSVRRGRCPHQADGVE